MIRSLSKSLEIFDRNGSQHYAFPLDFSGWRTVWPGKLMDTIPKNQAVKSG